MSSGVKFGRRTFVAAGAGVAAMAALPSIASAGGDTTPQYAYVGTYTGDAPGGKSTAQSEGVYVFKVDPATGVFTQIQAVKTENPSFLTLDRTQNYLYNGNEVDQFMGQKSGGATAWKIDPATGMLTLINSQPTVGTIVADIAVDPSNKWVTTANYVSGDYSVLPIRADGGLGPVVDLYKNAGTGPNTGRQEGPHAHAVRWDPAGRYLAGADLGIDKYQIFRLDPTTGKLTVVSDATVQGGAGPRHIDFHPSGRYAYGLNELDATITVFSYDNGKLTAIETVPTLPADFQDTKSTAEIRVHPSGRFIYASNRSGNTVAAFAINPTTGKLTYIERVDTKGEIPRNFAIDPSGTWLYAANQKTDTIVQYKIDPTTGKLVATGNVATVPTPVAIVFKSMSAAQAPGMPRTGGGYGDTLGAQWALLAGAGLAVGAALLRRRSRESVEARPE